MRFITRITIFLISIFACGQVKLPYQIVDKNGKTCSYEKMVKAAQSNEVVLFGEYHDNALAHWIELKFTQDLALNKQLILGAEMIESDNQKELNQYLSGEINQQKLDSVARLWPNYKSDYKPLVDFAKNKKLPFIATNVPRKYASLVYRKGFEALNDLLAPEKLWIAPLPIVYNPKLMCYSKMNLEMEGHGSDNLPKAQAIKDATMAHFIYKNKKKDSLFIHFNGSYHSNNFEGIYWYLKQKDPDLRILTIATVTQKNINQLEKEYYKIADFILIIDEDFTKS